MLGQALQAADGHVAPLVHAGDVLPVGPQDVHQQGQQQAFQPLDAHAQHLDAQQRAEAVHSQAGEMVGLAEDDAAAGQVLGTQHGFAVVPGVFQPAAPKGLVKGVVGVFGEHAHADLAFFA